MPTFPTPSRFGLLNVAAVSPALRVADVAYNTAEIVRALEGLAEQGCVLAAFPEMSLTGYCCQDLFFQSRLLDAVPDALETVAEATARHGTAALVGCPLRATDRLYNCAALLAGGRIVGVVPKTVLPTYNEFYEERWFAGGAEAQVEELDLCGQRVPFGVDLLFRATDVADCVIGVEICEDLWSVQPPSGNKALAGATLLVNPSASNEILGKEKYRRELVSQQAARCQAAYLYASAGPGESTTDVVFSGHGLVVENGALLAETERFRFETDTAVGTIDLQRLVHERLENTTFRRERPTRCFRTIDFELSPQRVEAAGAWALRRDVARTPFVPSDPVRNADHCREIFALQSTALAKRLDHVGCETAVIGLSGGLDSTLALLVTIRAFDRLGWSHARLLGVTMPGFGTTNHTQNNAERLADLLGITLRTISIDAAVRQHFADIGHDESTRDVTYENCQARERTQILMDLANQSGGLVVGTGDLSELALGWCTYNADHMSMYHVNAGVPKTLVRHLVSWTADEVFEGAVSDVLRSICNTPISPELLPPGEGDTFEQRTEETIGPYVLHDFFLFYVVRHGFGPQKILHLAEHAFDGEYDTAELVQWLRVFYRRFFANQFKRSAMPDGPKVGTVALSPRGDWRMASDARVETWLAELEED